MIVLHPTTLLSANTQYRFEVTDGVRDFSGAPSCPGRPRSPPARPGGRTSSAISFDKVAAAERNGQVVHQRHDRARRQALRRHDRRRDPPLPDQRRRHAGTPEVITSHPGRQRRTSDAHRPDLRPGVDGRQPDPVGHPQPCSRSTRLPTGRARSRGSAGRTSRPSRTTSSTCRARSATTSRTARVRPRRRAVLPAGRATRAMGAPDNAWGNRPERVLTAAPCCALDTSPAIAAPPLDVKTEDGGTYDPFAAGAPLTIYASGVRNAYDLRLALATASLYVPTNGSAAGGNTPATPAPLPALVRRTAIDDADQRRLHGPVGAGDPNVLGDAARLPVPRRRAAATTAIPTRRAASGSSTAATRRGGADPGEVTPVPGRHASRTATGAARVRLRHSTTRRTASSSTSSNTFGGALRGQAARRPLQRRRRHHRPDAGRRDPGHRRRRPDRHRPDSPASPTRSTSPRTRAPATSTSPSSVRPRPASRCCGPSAAGAARRTSRSSPARLIFNDVQNGAASAGQAGRRSRTPARAPLTISGGSRSPARMPRQFAAAAAPRRCRRRCPAGGTPARCNVAFDPTTAGPKGAAAAASPATIRTTPTTTVVLRGLGTLGLGRRERAVAAVDPRHLRDPGERRRPRTRPTTACRRRALLGDEVALQTFIQVATTVRSTLEPLAVFGPTGPAGNRRRRRPLHTGSPATKQQLFSVAERRRTRRCCRPRPAPCTFDPGLTDASASYSTWPFFADRDVYSEDSLNTWETDHREPPQGPRLPAEGAPSGVARRRTRTSSRPRSTSAAYDYQDVVYIVRQREAGRPRRSGREIATSVRQSSCSAASRGTTSADPDASAITNSGTAPLPITSLALRRRPNAALFTIVAARHVPFDRRRRRDRDRSTFASRRARPDRLAVGRPPHRHDDADEAHDDVGPLRPRHDRRAGQQRAAAEAGRRHARLSDQRRRHRADPGHRRRTPIGDEVRAPLFQKAGTGASTIKPVARYSPDELLPFGYYTLAGGEPVDERGRAPSRSTRSRRCNPQIVRGRRGRPSTRARSAFGIFVDSNSFGRKTYTQDGLNTGVPHAVRTYPAKDRAGQIDPEHLPRDLRGRARTATTRTTSSWSPTPSRPRPAGGAQMRDRLPAGRLHGRRRLHPRRRPAVRRHPRLRLGRPGHLDADRHDDPDPRPRRLRPTTSGCRRSILMQATATRAGVGVEYVLPNGEYSVTVGVGDASFIDSVHKVTVEGRRRSAPPTSCRRPPTVHETATVTVNVTDGRLTLAPATGRHEHQAHVRRHRRRRATGADTRAADRHRRRSAGVAQSAGVYRNTATVERRRGRRTAGPAWPRRPTASTAARSRPTPPRSVIVAPGAHTIRARAIDGAGNITTTASQDVLDRRDRAVERPTSRSRTSTACRSRIAS